MKEYDSAFVGGGESVSEMLKGMPNHVYMSDGIDSLWRLCTFLYISVFLQRAMSFVYTDLFYQLYLFRCDKRVYSLDSEKNKHEKVMIGVVSVAGDTGHGEHGGSRHLFSSHLISSENRTVASVGTSGTEETIGGW